MVHIPDWVHPCSNRMNVDDMGTIWCPGNKTHNTDYIDYSAYLDDSANQVSEDRDQRRSGGSKGAQQAGILTVSDISTVPVVPKPKILYLEHDVEEREFVHSYTKEEIVEMLGMNEEEFVFDFEDELNDISAFEPVDYVFEHVDDADDYDRVVVEDDSEEDVTNLVDKGINDSPTFSELFAAENTNLLKRKVEEAAKQGTIPQQMSRAEIAEKEEMV